MSISLLQLNIEEGKRWEEIVSYVEQNDFDILHFQEVTSGKNNKRGLEIYPLLLQKLPAYAAIQAVYWRMKHDPHTYMSNATFYKRSLTPQTSHTLFLKPYEEYETEEEMLNYAGHPTNALDVVFSISGKNIHFINTHLVWGPTPEDKPYKLEQGKKLYEYLRNLSEPFVLSGDFNVTADSQIVQWINELGVNHTTKLGVTNTLNPHTHRVQHLFPPGLAVDFVFTEKSLPVTDVQLIDSPDLSDHFGFRITLEV